LLVSSAIRDVTEQRRAVDRLKRREAQLAEAQAMASLGSWEWDLATDEVEWVGRNVQNPRDPPGGSRHDPKDGVRPASPNDRDIISALIERSPEILRTRRPSSTIPSFVPTGLPVASRARCDSSTKAVGGASWARSKNVTEQKRLEELADAGTQERGAREPGEDGVSHFDEPRAAHTAERDPGYSELLMLGVRGPVSSDQQDALSRIQRSGPTYLPSSMMC